MVSCMNTHVQSFLAEVPRVARQITQIAGRYNGRTWLVRIALPMAEAADIVREAIERELSDRGHAGIEVRVVVGKGDTLRLLSVEFDN